MDIILYILIGILVLFVGGLIVWGIYALVVAIYRKTLRYETFPSTAKVCNKEYEDEYTTYIMIGEIMTPQFHDEEYNVYLLYEGEEHCFDYEDLYEKVNVDDVIRVIVHKGYNKHDEVKHVYLSIED